MRPVRRNPNPAYSVAPTIDIYDTGVWWALSTKNNWQPQSKSKQFWTYKTTDVVAFMEWCVVQTKGTYSWDDSDDGLPYAINYLIDKIFGDGDKKYGYQNARLSLINNFGQYCSYCGMPVLDSSLAVEHMLPKSWFPDVMMCYFNFLVACSVCNSSNKGDQPTYDEAKIWAQNIYSSPINYNKIKAGGYDRYVWPSPISLNFPPSNPYRDDSNGAYKAFKIKVKSDSTTFTSAQIYDPNNKWESSQNNSVSVNVGGTVYNSAFTTFDPIIPPTPPVIPNVQQKARNMINMVGLDKTDFNNLHATDRRNTNRTIVFFEALAAFKRLNSLWNTAAYNAIAEQVLTTAHLSGFYEVWYDVFQTLSPGGSVMSFITDFKSFTTNPPPPVNTGNPSFYFPGTDATRLP